MIAPNAEQNILNFSINRFINEISPIYQINTLISNMENISSKLNSSEMMIPDSVTLQQLSEFGRHLMEEYTYISYYWSDVGYSQPALMGYLTETHNSDIDTDDLASVSPQINSYIELGNTHSYDSNAIWSLLAPHNYIISDYNSLTMLDISKIITTIKLEDTLDSNVSMSNQIFTYDIISSIVDSSLNSRIFDTGTSNLSFSGCLYSKITSPGGLVVSEIPSDIANFLSGDSIFYTNLTNKLSAITGISHASQEYLTNIRNKIHDIIVNYMVNSTNSFVDYIRLISDRVAMDSIQTYSKLIKNELTTTILHSLISDGILVNIDASEEETIDSIYKLYSSRYSHTILDIESACSRLSTNSLDLLNTHIHLYMGLFGSLDSFVVNDCSAYFQHQSEISSTIPKSDLVALIDNIIGLNDYSTSTIDNRKILNASIASSLTLNFEKYINQQQTEIGYANNLLHPILDAIVFNSNNTTIDVGKLETSITNVITSEFNSACWLRPYDVLLNSYPKFASLFDYTLPVGSLPNTMSNLDREYIRKLSQAKGDGVLPKVMAVSIFNIMLNSNLDLFAV